MNKHQRTYKQLNTFKLTKQERVYVILAMLTLLLQAYLIN